MSKQQGPQPLKPCPVCGVAMQVAHTEASLLYHCERCDLGMEFRKPSQSVDTGRLTIRNLRHADDPAQFPGAPKVLPKS
jgi:hypothetical protein